MYGSMEESPPAEAPALGPAELKAVRKLLATNGDDAQSAGLSHEPHKITPGFGMNGANAAYFFALCAAVPPGRDCRRQLLRALRSRELRVRIYLRRSILHSGFRLYVRRFILWQHVLRADGRMGRHIRQDEKVGE